MALASDPYWHKLVHYQRRNLGPRRSSAASPGFLLAERGRRDPAAELEATLRAFFEPHVPGTEHPQCRFIARRAWLDGRLHLDPSRLPRPPCPEFDEWYRTIDADRVTLVFASAYLNNPASMYGHTLLRIDQPGGASADQLVSYAINHAATTDERNGIVFAARGIFGGYLGHFSLLPYYDKVNEYSDLENRDLWEYELALTREETARLLMHAWELRETGFRYYFFLQNCSYRLLELLELARPGLEWTDRFHFWAIPTDTVRRLLETEGVLRAVRYRPGAATELEYHIGQLAPGERSMALAVALGDQPVEDAARSLDAAAAARVLEVAYEYLHYLRLAGAAQEPTTASRLHALLVARSRLPVASGLDEPPTPDVRPDEGHASR
ncbi:MAG: DUF4105 domain-containing protein, partial [bacterium]|nr:DUF4105 domain-containing protein [bacterium]